MGGNCTTRAGSITDLLVWRILIPACTDAVTSRLSSPLHVASMKILFSSLSTGNFSPYNPRRGRFYVEHESFHEMVAFQLPRLPIS